jgi:hypothetical protein
MIRFRFSPRKAYQAILWMLSREHGRQLDLHIALKTCYFADRSHLNAYGRPIFGALYKAMPYGPVPLQIYEMLKGEPYWLSELDADRFPWGIGGRGMITPDEGLPTPNYGVFSESDMEHLERGYDRASRMTFNERTRETHGPDWRRANLGDMDYADMIEDGPDHDEKVAELREIAPRLVI